MFVNNIVKSEVPSLIPSHLHFGQYIVDKLRDQEDGDALIISETDTRLTRKQLLQQVVNLSKGLRRLGVKKGDVLAICSENRIEFLVTTLAVICCGATVTLASISYTENELTHVFNISKPTIVFFSPKTIKLHLDTVRKLPYIQKVVLFDDKYPIVNSKENNDENLNDQKLGQNNKVFDDRTKEINQNDFHTISKDRSKDRDFNNDIDILKWTDLCSEPADVSSLEVTSVNSDDVVLLMYSSGTTGLPKGVMLTHLNFLFTAVNMNDESLPISRYLTTLPWSHAYGIMTTTCFILGGKTMVCLYPFAPKKYLEALQSYRCEMLLVVPPLVVFLAKSPLVEDCDTSSVQYLLSSAAPLSSETIKLAQQRFRNCKCLAQAYGMTENALPVCSDAASGYRNPKPGACGLPFPGVQYKVVDITTRERLGPFSKGEVCVKSPGVMKGYVGNPEATAYVMDPEGFLKSGDIGYYDDEGFLFIVDRLKEIIKYKGFQVPPAEVEATILELEAVADCGVAGRPHDTLGEVTTAFVVKRDGFRVTEQDIVDHVARKLSPVKRLHGGVIFVGEIPKNPSGKILRRILRERLKTSIQSKL